MQFRLLTLLIVVSVFAGWCANTFAMPLLVTLITLGFLLLLTPSVWICGIVYSRGSLQAFFIGGCAAAAIPFFLSLGYYLSYSDYAQLNYSLGEGWNDRYSLERRLQLAGMWLLPLVTGISGGGLGWLTRRCIVKER